jgi:pimeloyl-ACP methyl ester carboxylesterase
MHRLSRDGAGDLPEVILLPGMDGSGLLFGPFIDAMGGRANVTVVSYPADKLLGYPELADVVRPLLPPDRPFVLLAESFSGPVAVLLAGERPRSLRGVILCCTFLRNPRPRLGFLEGVVRRMWMPPLLPLLPSRPFFGRFSTASGRALFQMAMKAVRPAVIRHRLLAVGKVDATREFQATMVPVLYMRATEDVVVPAVAMDTVLRAKPDTQVIDVTAPHFLLQVAAVAAAEHVLTFLGSLACAPEPVTPD